jgi:hypothetical protein
MWFKLLFVVCLFLTGRMLINDAFILHTYLNPKVFRISDDEIDGSIDRVSCINKDGISQGTGTVVAKNKILTAYHVIAGRTGPCYFSGEKYSGVLYEDSNEDVAILSVNTNDLPITDTTCEGFSTGKTYLAAGYPGALNSKIDMWGSFIHHQLIREFADIPPVLAGAKVIATNQLVSFESDDHVQHDHLRIMRHELYQGMSGGPVVDNEGVIHGIIISSYGEDSANRELSTTHLCNRNGESLFGKQMANS